MKTFREANGTIYFDLAGMPLDFFLTLAPDYPPVGNGNVRVHSGETRHVVIAGTQQADPLSPNIVDGYLRRSGEFIAAWESESARRASPAEPMETPSPEEQRRRAYEAEADPLRDQAISYQLAGDAWEARGDDGRAEIAWAKAAEFMGKYLDVKEAIRAKYS